MENPIKMDDLGVPRVPLFSETSIWYQPQDCIFLVGKSLKQFPGVCIQFDFSNMDAI